MVPATYREFFAAAAGAAGALVGLLFVAISVAREPVVGDHASVRQQVRASTALLALLSPLLMSLVALLPTANVGWAAAIYGVAGLLFAAATVRRLLSSGEIAGDRLTLLRQVGSFVGVAGLDLWSGITLIHAPHALRAVNLLAVAVIVSLGLGVDRAWDLVGGRQRSARNSIADLLGAGGERPPESAPAADESSRRERQEKPK